MKSVLDNNQLLITMWEGVKSRYTAYKTTQKVISYPKILISKLFINRDIYEPGTATGSLVTQRVAMHEVVLKPEQMSGNAIVEKKMV